MSDDISRVQFYQRVQEAADRISELERQNEVLRKALQEATASKVQMPSSYSIKHVEGHGWIIDPPHGSRWIAFEGTPAGDFMAALTTAPLQSSRIGSDKGPCNCGADRTAAVGAGYRIDLTDDEAAVLRDYIGDTERPVTLIEAEGRAGYGLYVFDTEYPDECGEFIAAVNRLTASSAAHQEGNLATQGREGQ